MRAGIDLGTTLTKAVWVEDGEYKFASTADMNDNEFFAKLLEAGVDDARLVGLGEYLGPREGWTLNGTLGDPIVSEVELQAKGTKMLLDEQGVDCFPYLLVGMGTRTSYALIASTCEESFCKPFPYDNPISGGYIRGLGTALGLHKGWRFDRWRDLGEPSDLLVRDLRPEIEGPRRNFVIAHFGKVPGGGGRPSTLASVINSVAVSTARDVAMINQMGEYGGFKDVVYVGSAVHRIPGLAKQVKSYMEGIGLNCHVPDSGEYALALGAFHAEDMQPL